jgi:metal-responsive CopG/Arc/MetJ family transcriptional regulator
MPRPAVSKKRNRISLTIDAALLDRAKKVAEEESRTVSDVIREAILRYVIESRPRRDEIKRVIADINARRVRLKPQTDSVAIIRAMRDGRR